ncbi:DNA photolyase, putative [Eimeria mitis]|uniref:Deoxyribodipyrimidine photo-lyase n=1 Tax=Eimeria mitis TaxID=44415 RepID=U6JNB1_9EIME|nr:DNA photolyase, putative [Eimeria mitis]CDJ27030.1 DNA photolyase, putative [Eimeria mitis]
MPSSDPDEKPMPDSSKRRKLHRKTITAENHSKGPSEPLQKAPSAARRGPGAPPTEAPPCCLVSPGSAATSGAWLQGTVDSRRVRCLTPPLTVPNPLGESVVCILQRDLRFQDNWALLFAQDAALSLRTPLHVVHLVVPGYTYQRTARHLQFHLQGLKELAEDLAAHDIAFHCFPVLAAGGAAASASTDSGSATAAAAEARERIEQVLQQLRPKLVVCDFMPLRELTSLMEQVGCMCTEALRCPLYEIDAHNIVPAWIASSKQEYAARTFRSRVMPLLADFCCDFPKVRRHPYKSSALQGVTANASQQLLQQVQQQLQVDDSVPLPPQWMPGAAGGLAALTAFCSPQRLSAYASQAQQQLQVDDSVPLPPQWMPGAAGGLAALTAFCSPQRLSAYASRNDPLLNTQSGISPWLHFGQLGAQRCLLAVRGLGPAAKIGAAASAGRASFIEELVVRRELAENFTFYNAAYDQIAGAPQWAQQTLEAHQGDKREHVYSLAHFEDAKTHDNLWNAAQLQLVHDGKMHGFLRMYWAKKILEWSPSAAEALKTALYLNDRFSLDGTDPNGVVGCMWSVAGLHDQGWAERPVFGKIRYMNFAGCKRKFDVDAFVQKVQESVRKRSQGEAEKPPKRKLKQETSNIKGTRGIQTTTTSATKPKKNR